MKAIIQDMPALSAVSPMALAAYAQSEGWKRLETFGDHSDVYVADGLPEIIVPRMSRLGDYPQVVAQLIGIFADVVNLDAIAVYRDLVIADRDVVRIRAVDAGQDGSVSVEDGMRMVNGAHEILLAAACSLKNPQPFYRAGANKEAGEFLKQVRLGQTEHGSFVVTLLTPVISPPMQPSLFDDVAKSEFPVERRITAHLSNALEAVRTASEQLVGGEKEAFIKAVQSGISANLCDGIVAVAEPYSAVDISLSWARTRPMEKARNVAYFGRDDVPILREAARAFREREPRPDTELFGFVRLLRRDAAEDDGTVTLRTSLDGQMQSVNATLKQSDYERAIQAHKDKHPVILMGDLERYGQRWRLLNPQLVSVVEREEEE